MQGIFFCKNKNITTKKANIVFLLTVLTFLFGVLCGAVSILYKNDINEFYIEFLNIYTKEFVSQSYLQICSQSFFSNLICLLILLFFAYSCFGFIPAFLVVLYKGFSIGTITTFLFAKEQGQGIVINLLKFFPFGIVSGCIIIIFCCFCIYSSFSLLKINVSKKQGLIKFDYILPLNYFFAITLAILVCSALLNLGNLIKI